MEIAREGEREGSGARVGHERVACKCVALVNGDQFALLCGMGHTSVFASSLAEARPVSYTNKVMLNRSKIGLDRNKVSLIEPACWPPPLRKQQQSHHPLQTGASSANMAHIRQSRPDSRLGLHVKMLSSCPPRLKLFLSSCSLRNLLSCFLRSESVWGKPA